jgi:transcriptional regulator of acetoin/glycerol metabolism
MINQNQKRPKTNIQKVGFHSQDSVNKSWDRFISSGGNINYLKIRDVIASSWERCLSEGVNPEQKTAPLLAAEGKLERLFKINKELLDCASPIMNQAQTFIRDLDTILFITDYQGVNLKMEGDPDTLDEALGIGLIPGCGWNEISSGSNAVGTAIETLKPVQMFGEEHFCLGFKPWTCTATTICDPYDNQLLAVLDLSGLSNNFDQFHAPLVDAWANQIQERLAKIFLEKRSVIEECSNSKTESGVGKLLFDTQGRLLNFSKNAPSILSSLGLDYDPLLRRRLSFQKFGGEKILYPHENGKWVSEDWLEPIKHDDEIVGFQLHIPSTKSKVVHTSENTLVQSTEKFSPFKNIYGISASFKASSKKAIKAATTPLPILILGETGVGKEVFAKAIHESSNFNLGPLVDLNCGAFTKDLLNSELFGYVEGAFTGAKKGGMIGKLESANGGTLFLDEIGEMPLEMQSVFLRVLQEQKIYRIGSIKPTPVNFRLVTATNCNLKDLVAEGRFRMDLYFRLSTVSITLDTLSERKEDIEGIAKLVLERVNSTQSVIPKYLSSELLSMLKNEKWPGNIRELKNVVEYMSYMSQNETLTIEDLPEGYEVCNNYCAKNIESNEPARAALSNLDKAALAVIDDAIKQSSGNITQAAKRLGMAKGTLYQRMKKYGLTKAS